MSNESGRGFKIFSMATPFLMLIAGMFMLPMQIMKNDLSRIPGDHGDARFNNYVLEHGHLYLTGKVSDYWNGPFMYPYKNTIAMSDNLLGTLPFYSFFRQAGADRETAFQIWILALFALNYLCSFFVLKQWTTNNVLAACGAYIFAFGIYNIGQTFHAQVFPRFISPLVIFWTWKYLESKELRFFILSLLGLVYQFYCGIYLGFLLVFCVSLIIMAHLIIFRKNHDFSYLHDKRRLFYHIVTVTGAIALLFPLFKPYILISTEVGFRDWGEVYNSIPRFRSYFFTSPASTFWSGLLYDHSAYKFEGWWNHFLFIGALPWLTVLLVPYLLLNRKVTSADKKAIATITVSLALVFLFSLKTQGITLWRIIYEIPGFSSMRSLDRIINIEAFLFVLLFVLVIQSLLERSRKRNVILAFLPIITIADNLIKPEEHKSFKKADAIILVDEVKSIIKDSEAASQQAVAYSPVTYSSPTSGPDQNKLAELHLNAMLASQELGIACVNGYSGFEPGNYSAYFDRPSKSNLINWLAFNESEYNKVKIATGLHADILETRYINLKGSNGNYLCCDETVGNQIVANKTNPDLWETFLLIKLSDGKVAILAHNNQYFSSDLNNSGQLAAIKPRAYDWELFEINLILEDRITLKASNGKFLKLENQQGFINATGETPSNESTFQIIYK